MYIWLAQRMAERFPDLQVATATREAVAVCIDEGLRVLARPREDAHKKALKRRVRGDWGHAVGGESGLMFYTLSSEPVAAEEGTVCGLRRQSVENNPRGKPKESSFALRSLPFIHRAVQSGKRRVEAAALAVRMAVETAEDERRRLQSSRRSLWETIGGDGGGAAAQEARRRPPQAAAEAAVTAAVAAGTAAAVI